MARSLQLEFKKISRPELQFGGKFLGKNHAKRARPLSSKLPVHVVLRSSRATGLFSLRYSTHFVRVNRAVTRTAKKYGVTLYKYANVGNHLHLLIKLHSVKLWAPFIRELTGRIAWIVCGSCKPPLAAGGFWDWRPFTRVIAGWRKAFRDMVDYVGLNLLEGEGLISRRDFRTLRDLRLFLSDG